MKALIVGVMVALVLFISSPLMDLTQSRYTDFACVNDCMARGYSYQLCLKMCSY